MSAWDGVGDQRENEAILCSAYLCMSIPCRDVGLGVVGVMCVT